MSREVNQLIAIFFKITQRVYEDGKKKEEKKGKKDIAYSQ